MLCSYLLLLSIQNCHLFPFQNPFAIILSSSSNHWTWLPPYTQFCCYGFHYWIRLANCFPKSCNCHPLLLRVVLIFYLKIYYCSVRELLYCFIRTQKLRTFGYDGLNDVNYLFTDSGKNYSRAFRISLRVFCLLMSFHFSCVDSVQVEFDDCTHLTIPHRNKALKLGNLGSKMDFNTVFGHSIRESVKNLWDNKTSSILHEMSSILLLGSVSARWTRISSR